MPEAGGDTEVAAGQGDFCLLSHRGCGRKQKRFGAGWRSLGCVPVSPNPRRGRAEPWLLPAQEKRLQERCRCRLHRG